MRILCLYPCAYYVCIHLDRIIPCAGRLLAHVASLRGGGSRGYGPRGPSVVLVQCVPCPMPEAPFFATPDLAVLGLLCEVGREVYDRPCACARRTAASSAWRRACNDRRHCLRGWRIPKGRGRAESSRQSRRLRDGGRKLICNPTLRRRFFSRGLPDKQAVQVLLRAKMATDDCIIA